MIDQRDFQFTTVIGIDGADGVDERDAMFGGQSGSCANLHFKSGWNFDLESGFDQSDLSRLDFDLTFDRSAQIESGGMLGLSGWKWKIARMGKSAESNRGHQSHLTFFIE